MKRYKYLSECTGDKEAFIEDFKTHFEYESNT